MTDATGALARWRERMQWSQRKAADALGLTLATYQAQELGQSWTTGKPVKVKRAVLLACAALEHGLEPVTDEPA